MNISEWIIPGGILGLVGLVLKFYNDVNNKIGRAYKRLDEVKSDMSETYTRKDMCQVLHTQIRNDLTELKLDMKKLLEK